MSVLSVQTEQRALGARKGRTSISGDTAERARIDRRLVVLSVALAAAKAAEAVGPLTADEVAEVIAEASA